MSGLSTAGAVSCSAHPPVQSTAHVAAARDGRGGREGRGGVGSQGPNRLLVTPSYKLEQSEQELRETSASQAML